MRLMCALAAFLTILPFTSTSAAESTYRAWPRVRVIAGGIEYGDQRIQGQAVILQGEPLVLEIGIANQYNGPTAAAELDWLQRIVVSVARGGRFDFSKGSDVVVHCDTMGPMRSQNARTEEGRVVLSPTGFAYAQCVLNTNAYKLGAGRYTLIAKWARSDDMLPFRERPGLGGASIGMTDLLEFEVRDVKTSGDQADLLNHLALHALMQRQPNSALHFLRQLFLVHPFSVTGLTTSARAHAALGECGQAVTDLKRAAAIVEGALDSGNTTFQPLEAEHRRAAAQSLRDRAVHLACPGQ